MAGAAFRNADRARDRARTAGSAAGAIAPAAGIDRECRDCFADRSDAAARDQAHIGRARLDISRGKHFGFIPRGEYRAGHRQARRRTRGWQRQQGRD